ncbi:hypothetical protein ITI46_07410 [Streptomyces oryzae]|uniref:Uncharacterized protein n=1 Tax=Streptomyces oryzae TaxID=1434886 RepID=A0ABS3X826_9ACTN|nr:hypothetical protein [Streptomyces oryzae]MBO8191518.1 hypothetical protein [Streptomyces oryzae]
MQEGNDTGDAGLRHPADAGRTVHALDARGTVRDWLISPVWGTPADDLGKHLAAEGDPWGEQGRWRLTNGPDVTPLKEELHRHRPLRRDPVATPPVEGGPVRCTGPDGTEHTGTWRRVHTPADGLVDWSEFCFTPEYRTALAACVLEVDQAEWRTLRLAATGPVLLFVNGELVGESGTVTYMEPAEQAVRVWLPSGTSTVVVASWQVAFRECRHVVRLRVDGLPVRVVVPGEGACEHTGAVAERILDAVGVPRGGTTSGEVEITGPEGAALRVDVAGRTRRIRLTGGRATVRLDDGEHDEGPDSGHDGDHGTGSASMLSTGTTVLRIAMDDERSPVYREFPVAVLPRSYRAAPEGPLAERRAEFLRHAARADGTAGELARALADPAYRVTASGVSHALWMIDNRADCADFEAVGLLHLWHRIPADRWEAGLRTRVRDAILGFKFWIDQPGLDAMCYFTENHQLVWHTAELLWGSELAGDTFGNTGWTGAQHAAHARGMAIAWMRRKLAGGFSEFDSNAYLAIDLLALVTLVEFAKDEAVVQLAAGVADRVLFSLAANSWRGIHGCAHGRSYVSTLRSSRLEETAPIMWVCFGTGALNDAVLPAAAVATAVRYRMPDAIREAAHHLPERWWGRQSYRGEYRPTHDLLARPYASDLTICKTPDAMLSCVSDYRPGLPGLQEHIWGATLGPETQVYVTHAPNTSTSPSARPNAWAGNRILPRARQHEATVLALYRIPGDDAMGYTHAWFPVAEFDEWLQYGVWTVGRKGDGYVALATEGGALLTDTGPEALQELRPKGPGTAWVCTIGRRALHGELGDFARALATPRFGPGRVGFRTPEGTELDLSWDGPFTVDGRPADLAEDGTVAPVPQLDNPCARLEFGDRTLTIAPPAPAGAAPHVIDLQWGRQVTATEDA